MIILYNAKIITQNPVKPHVSALAIDRDRIIALGNDHEILAEFDKGGVEKYNLDGRVVIPGLVDAHIHLQHYALGLKKVECETSTRQECLNRVALRAQETPPGEWVLGHGWNQNDWPEGFGTASDLDAIAPDHPVYLTAKSLHAAWANTAALRQAGINAQTSDPPGGKLGRDSEGNLDGILFETAMDLVSRAVPVPSLEQVTRALNDVQPVFWQMGLTGAHDFDQRQCFAALQTLQQRGELKLRIVKSIPLDDLPHAVEVGLRSGFGDDFLRIGSIKVFADGALGPRTAAMFQPYETEPENRGMLMMDSEQLFEHGCLAVANGLGMAVHAIGDLANHEVLNAISQIRHYERENRLPQTRMRIEHVQVLHPGDAHRLSELGVIASMQPIHATSDMTMAGQYWGNRSALSYAWKTQLESGAALAFGSDAPVESPHPFWGIHAAVTRRRRDGAPGPEGWYPEQRLSVAEALKAYTVGAAYAAGMEDRLGQLAPGFLADLLILDVDPFTCPPEQLLEIKPLATMVAGSWVWQKPA
ncbi:MAG: amidohydrolase [Chloroflexota bacterium]|nr:MAG: amidohydrolase [Chloroflexota bacterium]